MRLIYDEIIIKKRKLLNTGEIEITDRGVNLLKGDNGIGKTSVLKNIYFKNKEIAVFVDQDNNEILEELSIVENIAMSLNEKLKSETIEILVNYNLEHLLKLDIRKLSGGEKRIVSLLRGILSDAPLILIDEPTNDLDYVMVEKLIKIISDYSNVKSFFIITHDNRLEQIARRGFYIKNQTIIIDENNQYNDFSCDKSTNDTTRKNHTYDNTVLLNRIFKRKYLGLVLILLFFVLSIFSLQSFKQIEEKKIPNIHPRQVDIFVPLSTVGSRLITKGTYPIGVIDALKVKSIFNKEKLIKDLVEKSSNTAINYGLKLESNKKYIVYPIEYYDTEIKASYYTLDTYLSDVLKVSPQKVSVDTSSVFTKEELGFENDIKYSFENDIFKQSTSILESKKSISGRRLEILFLTVILSDEIDLYDFIQNSQLKSGNFYFRSNETIELTNQITSFLGWRNILVINLFFSFLLIMIEALYYYSLMRAYSKRIVILVNYAFDQTRLRHVILNKFNDKRFGIISIILLMLVSSFLVRGNGQWQLLGNYFMPLLFSVTLYISHKINKKIILSKINKINSWRYR